MADTKKIKIGALANQVVLAVFAFGLFAFSVLSALGVEKEEDLGWEFTGNIQWNTQLVAEELLTLQWGERDQIQLMPGAEASLTWDHEARHVNVDLLAGVLGFAAESGDFSVSVSTPYARIDSQNSSAYVSADEGKLTAYALNHSSLAVFTLDDAELSSLNIPGGHRLKVNESKVTSTLAKLRYTKLTKEFPVYEIKESDWTADLTAFVNSYEEDYTAGAAKTASELQKSSDLGPDLDGIHSNLSSVYHGFRAALTFLPDAEERYVSEIESEALLYAMSHFEYGDLAAANHWLNVWISTEPDELELQTLHASLHAVLPGDSLYPVKESANELLYGEDDVLSALRRRYDEIESLLARGSKVDAEAAYEEYQKAFEVALSAGYFEEKEDLDALNREYVLVERLLRSHSVFYTSGTLDLLSAMESQILALAGLDVDEERQAFVQSKLRFLTNLFDYVEERKVAPENASELAKQLIDEGEGHLNSVVAKTATLSYFAQELKDADVALQFIGSSEFYSYEDFDEGVEAYSAKLADISALNEYIHELKTGSVVDVAELSLEDAEDAVRDDFRRNGIQFSKLDSLGDTEFRLFEVKGARTDGYAFDGKYDRESQIFYEVEADELRFSTGILLDNLRDVLKQSIGEILDPEEEEVPADEETVAEQGGDSLAESVAMQSAESAFKDAGFEDFDVTLIDLNENLFRFTLKIGKYGIPVTGLLNLDSGKVSEAVWLLDSEEQDIPLVPLSSLEKVVEASYEVVVE